MNDTAQTLLRSVLKIGAGALISRGLINGSEGEVLISALLGIAAVIWGVMHRTKAKGPDDDLPTTGPTGRALAVVFVAGLLLFCGGCAWQHTASVHKSDGSLAETYTGVVWFNRTALKGLEAHRKSANGSSAALSLKEGNTETQPDALKAGSESLGMLIGTAMKYAK